MVRPRRRWPLSHPRRAIVGQDRDPQAAIRLAKRMIVDGRMPSPEEAHAQLRTEQEREKERAKTLANKQTSNKQQTNKRKQKPLGELIVGDITARSELVPVAVPSSKAASLSDQQQEERA
jgi:hypothetical protein